jgi:uncharacterized Ntn-hydrolase superfamily protein
MTKLQAKHEIAEAAKEALRVISSAAATALTVTKSANGNDHDLLQRLDQKVDQIQSDVSDLKKDKSVLVNQTEHSEVVKCVNDHETRIRYAEKSITKILTWGSVAVVLIGIIEFVLNLYIRNK